MSQSNYKNVLRIFVNPEYPELIEIYKKAVEEHQKKLRSKFPDSGFDLYVPSDETFTYDSLMKTKMIDFQLKTEMKCSEVYSGGGGFFDRSKAFYLYARSSLSKTPLMLSNHVGVVDSGYRGNLMGAFRCLYRNNTVNEDGSEAYSYVVPKHTRLVQICLASLEPFQVEMVDKLEDLSSTERGEGGFGSTGGTVAAVASSS
jgi:dUTP pyrophosphatase